MATVTLSHHLPKAEQMNPTDMRDACLWPAPTSSFRTFHPISETLAWVLVYTIPAWPHTHKFLLRQTYTPVPKGHHLLLDSLAFMKTGKPCRVSPPLTLLLPLGSWTWSLVLENWLTILIPREVVTRWLRTWLPGIKSHLLYSLDGLEQVT